MSNLQFQSFTNQNFDMSDEGPGGGGASGAQKSSSYAGQLGDRGFGGAVSPGGNDSTATAGPKRNFFSFGFYQQFFDVDTETVGKRILNSAVPTHKNFIADFIQPLPDLYGPFWVCVTLVFSIGIFSNIAQYIENQGAPGTHYGSDFGMVTGASSLIASYVIIVPCILSTVLWYRKSEVQYSFLDILCAYGYSLSIFIPVSMLWVIDANWLRWALIFGSVMLSGTVLVRALWPAFASDPNKMVTLGMMFGIIVLHFALAFCFKEVFFDPANPARGPVAPPDHIDPTQPPPLTTGPLGVGGGDDKKVPQTGALLVSKRMTNDTDTSGAGGAAINGTNLDNLRMATTIAPPAGEEKKKTDEKEKEGGGKTEQKEEATTQKPKEEEKPAKKEESDKKASAAPAAAAPKEAATPAPPASKADAAKEQAKVEATTVKQ